MDKKNITFFDIPIELYDESCRKCGRLDKDNVCDGLCIRVLLDSLS